ncbi:hypothetical protein ACLMJK_008775 [Lecanora helva]
MGNKTSRALRKIKSLNTRNSDRIKTDQNESDESKKGLNEMPLEVLKMICVNLEPVEVMKIRYVNRKIAKVAFQYLCKSIHLKYTESSYERFLRIALNPTYSQQVKTISFDGDVFDDVDPFIWTRYIEPVDANNSETTQSLEAYGTNSYEGPLEINRAHVLYQEYCANQKQLQQHNFFAEELTVAMTRLPNLKSLYMTRFGSLDSYETEVQQFLEVTFPESVSYYDDEVTQTLLSAVENACQTQGRILALVSEFDTAYDNVWEIVDGNSVETGDAGAGA